MLRPSLRSDVEDVGERLLVESEARVELGLRHLLLADTFWRVKKGNNMTKTK
jgi:hypothetical protein